LNVRPTDTVSNVLEFLSVSTNLPCDVELLHDGKALEPSSTVAQLQLQESATLQLSPPVRSGSPMQDSQAIEGSTNATSAPTPSTDTAVPVKKPAPARKSNKPKCSKEGCKTAAQPIIGDCGFCNKRYCGKHRMLESHNCSGLDDARQADKDRNTAKLEGERTVMLRGL